MARVVERLAVIAPALAAIISMVAAGFGHLGSPCGR